MPNSCIPQRSFNHADQMAFAELSGDFNPLHVDEMAARRLLFGCCVVHGVHALLWALGCWLQDKNTHVALRDIDTDFRKPIPVGERVAYTLRQDTGKSAEITLSADGLVVTVIRFSWASAESARWTNHLPASVYPRRKVCEDRRIEAFHSIEGQLQLFLREDAATRLLGNALSLLPSRQLAILLATSRLVGVECPGLHSLYSRLSLSFEAERAASPQSLHYSVLAHDPRFNLVEIGVQTSGVKGRIKAFVRPSPARQAAYSDIKLLVRPSEFTGQRALVVGGSRGLGEVTAKLLAGGGAKVTITYAKGAADAYRVVQEIRAEGGIATCVPFDAVHDTLDADLLDKQEEPTTHLYYFATPFIVPSPRASFSHDRFEDFCRYYVSGFARLCGRLVQSGLQAVLYPSSVYLDEVPRSLGEYITAKGAGETLCIFLETAHRGLVIHRPRLPRMSTDQTVSLVSRNTTDPSATMLEEIRHLNGLLAERQAR